jgi:hypothetical protein
MKKLFSIPIALLLFTSCEVDFSPNAPWKNVPVIYCVLDQDEDTTWARVERCYLGEDSIYSFSSISDSVNYPQGSINVALLGYENGVLKDSMAFNYTERDRDSGSFAHTAQPLYWYETRHKLKEAYTYVLSVRNTADGSLLACSTPVCLIKQTNPNVITKPIVSTYGSDTTGGLKFYDIDPNTNERKYCLIQWNPLENGRLYQPFVRFYYQHDGESTLRHADLLCPRVTSKSTQVLYSRDRYLADLKYKLKDDTCSRKVYVPRVDLYLTCCSEELNDYLNSVSQSGSADQGHPVYTNIIGGVGVFASRRTHLYKTMPSDKSLQENVGLLWHIKNLDIGFIR